MIVENRLTPLTLQDATRALVEAYTRVTGGAPSTRVLALLLAQTAFETGYWQKIHSFNFGNIKADLRYPLITQFRCSEVEQGVQHFFDPPDPRCNFRAYANPADGAVDYVWVLQSRPHWWNGLHSEDPNAFADALATQPKYFTGDPHTYKYALGVLFEKLRPLAGAAVRQPCLASVPSRLRFSSARFADPVASEGRRGSADARSGAENGGLR